MGKVYDNPEDLRMRLNNTICFYKREPYYILVGGVKFPEVELMSIVNQSPPQKHKIVDHRSKDLCTNSPKLGYMNFENNSFYLSRIPERSQNQGLRTSNIIAMNENYLGGWNRSRDFYNTLKGIYPSKKEALTRVQNNYNSCAFHRKFSFNKFGSLNIGLQYMGNSVGILENNNIKLFQNKATSYIHKLLIKENLYD